MKKRNAFTLVELLAVIVILAIVLIIAVPGVLSIINKTKDSAYDRQIDMIKDAAKNYVTANTITWSGDNPKSTLVTLEMLQSGGYLDKKILDPRNKKEILCANVLVTKDNKNKITYDVDMTCNEVQPITPRVGSGMIPIVYKDGNWVKADTSNKDFAWFNYGNQQWANVATVTEDVRQSLLDAPVGTEVPMDKINTMFTWIPRFKYKLFNVDGTIHADGNKNLRGNRLIDVQFETASTTKSTGTQNGQWLTHPAFTFGGQELEGFWVAKFETGRVDAKNVDEALGNYIDPTKITIKPGLYSWRMISNATMFKNARGLADANNLFGLTAKEDPHLIKNMEWGAMTYLTFSSYGKQGNSNYTGDNKYVRINNMTDYITGCGANVSGEETTTICNTYDTENGMSASTTGNITGIYDTVGGSWDYTAAILKNMDGTTAYIEGSSFTQDELNDLINENKYFDVYEYSTEFFDRSRGHLGDATIELGPFIEEHNTWDTGSTILNTSFDKRGLLLRGAPYFDNTRAYITVSFSWGGGASTGVTSRITMI